MTKIERKVKQITEQKNLTYNKLIKIIKEDSDSNCIKKFEEKLFGEFEKYYGDTVEKNTDYENEVFKELKKFLAGDYMRGDKSEIEKHLKELLDCKNVYDNILEPKNFEILYRSERMKLTDLANYQWEFASDENFHYKTKMKYNPKSNVQSWTRRYQKTEIFPIGLDRSEIDTEDNVKVIMHLENPNSSEFIFDPDFLNLIEFKEEETIRVGGSVDVICEFNPSPSLINHIFKSTDDKNLHNALLTIDPQIKDKADMY